MSRKVQINPRAENLARVTLKRERMEEEEKTK
jgi:hypothetical protein